MKVLFVCTGNTCRSPMAEGIFNHLSQGAFSRGICAEGGKASPNSIKAMENMGIDITGHISTQLTTDDVNDADLVITMTLGHKNIILNAMPEMAEKVFTVGEYTDGSDISDPYGGDLDVYTACAEELYEKIERIIERLK